MYSEVPEVEKMAETVIDQYGDTLQDVYGQPCRIKYLSKNSKKSQFLGKCCKASGFWKHLTDFDYVIIVWETFWKNATELEKKALLFHELKHIKLEEKETPEGDIEIKWSLAKHQVELFVSELELFGAWHEPLDEVVSVCKELT
jgi:hypothetical protein